MAAFVYDYQYLLASILNYLYKEQASYNCGRISCMTRENCNRFDQEPRGPDLISKNIRMQIRSLDSKVIRCDMTEHVLNQPRPQCFLIFQHGCGGIEKPLGTRLLLNLAKFRI